MAERNYLYDNIKGFLIIITVLAHLLGCAMTRSDILVRTVILFIYYFHMPLFVFVSGYFSKNPDKSREKAFRNLFAVFAVAQVCWAVFKFFANNEPYYFHNFLDPGYALWYIVALFFWRILLKDVIKLRFVLVLAFLAAPFIMFIPEAQMILALNKIVGFFFFFLLGYYANEEHIAKIRKIPRKAAIIALAAIFAVTFGILQYDTTVYGFVKGIFMYTNLMSNVADTFGNVPLGLLAYYCSTAVTVLCSVLVIAAAPEKQSFLSHVGGDTLPLYLSHTYFIILLDLFFVAVPIPHLVKYVIILAVTALLVLAFSSAAYRKGFHRVLDAIINLFLPKPKEKKTL